MNYNAQSNDALSILLDIFDDGNNIDTMFKYYTVKSLDDIPKYEFNETITAIRKGDKIEVIFNEIYTSLIENLTIDYYIQGFYIKDIEDLNTVNTIHPDGPYFNDISVLENFTEGTRTEILNITSSDDSIVKIIAFLDNTVIEENIAYPYVKVIDPSIPPVPVDPVEPKKYSNITINADTKKSLKISKDDTTHNIYQIEMIPGNSTLSKQYVEFSFEPYTEYPTYKNRTEIKIIKREEKKGMKTFIIECKTDITLSFFVNANEGGSADISIKYITVAKESDIKVYTPEDYSVDLQDNKLSVSFKELFTDATEVKTINYYIKQYYKINISDISLINTVNNLVEPINITKIEGTNNGTKFNITNKDLNDTVYIVLTAEFELKDSNEEKVNYGLKEVKVEKKKEGNSYWILWVILIVVAIALIGGIVFYLVNKKRNGPLIPTPIVDDVTNDPLVS